MDQNWCQIQTFLKQIIFGNWRKSMNNQQNGHVILWLTWQKYETMYPLLTCMTWLKYEHSVNTYCENMKSGGSVTKAYCEERCKKLSQVFQILATARAGLFALFSQTEHFKFVEFCLHWTSVQISTEGSRLMLLLVPGKKPH